MTSSSLVIPLFRHETKNETSLGHNYINDSIEMWCMFAWYWCDCCKKIIFHVLLQQNRLLAWLCNPLQCILYNIYTSLCRILLKHTSSEVKGVQLDWFNSCLQSHSPWLCAFSCDSSNHDSLCWSNCTSCKQRVSRQCVKACDISGRLTACKRSCTDCKQRDSLQNAAVCVSWYH